MVVSKPLSVAGALLAGLWLAACTSTGGTSSASVETKLVEASTAAAYPRLPDTVVTVPMAFAADEAAGGPIAEASAAYAVTVAEAPAQPVAVAQIAATDVAAPVMESAGKGQANAVLASISATDAATFIPASYAGSTPNATRLAVQPMEEARSDPSNAALIHAPDGRLGPSGVEPRSPELDALMARYANHYEVPEELVRRVAKRESTFNPKARNGPYWGLMQIRHDTAKGMGYQGSATGLLDAETNLKYAVRYLRGAWLVAKGNLSVADKLYQRGYYYDAKRAGLLDETGLGKDRRRRNPS